MNTELDCVGLSSCLCALSAFVRLYSHYYIVAVGDSVKWCIMYFCVSLLMQVGSLVHVTIYFINVLAITVMQY